MEKCILYNLQCLVGRECQIVVCILHGNVLPFRAIFYHYDGTTSGSSSFTGTLELVNSQRIPFDELPILKMLYLISGGTKNSFTDIFKQLYQEPVQQTWHFLNQVQCFTQDSLPCGRGSPLVHVHTKLQTPAPGCCHHEIQYSNVAYYQVPTEYWRWCQTCFSNDTAPEEPDTHRRQNARKTGRQFNATPFSLTLNAFY